MIADIERTCLNGHRFWWTVDEQLACEDRQEPPPTECRRCRSRRTALVPQRQNNQLVERSLFTVNLPATLGDQDPLFARVQELLLYSASNYVPRTQTFLEWWRKEDPNAAEIQARQWAGQHAQDLMARRHELLRLVRDQDETVRHRVEQHIASQLAVMRAEVERRRLEAEAERIEFQRETQRLEAAARHRALLAPPEPPAPPEDPLRRAAAEHRHQIQVEAEVKQDILSDFWFELEKVCALRISVTKKALRIRAVMEAFELDEDSLPEDAARILRVAERLRDAD